MTTDEKLSDILIDFARTMVTDFSIQSILDHLVGCIAELLPVTGAGVTLISSSVKPHYVAASNASALRYEKLQSDLADGPCLAAYRTGAVVVMEDLTQDDDLEIFRRHAVAAGLRAVFAFPLHQGERRLGALDLYRDTPGVLLPAEMAVAQTLADVASAYLVNAQARADLEAASQRSRESAAHDALTGLPNRLLLVERLEHAVSRSRRRPGSSLAVLFADLDQFKKVNDVHGHQVGDDLLVAVGLRLSRMLRPGDTLARLSGDEFVILCEDLDEERQAELIAARVVQAFQTPFAIGRLEIQITASVGIAFGGGSDQTPQQLLKQADLAMYRAKRQGGHRHQAADLREPDAEQQRASLRAELRSAVRQNQLRLEYQPILRTRDRQLVAAEAVLRWSHPLRGRVPVKTIESLAEEAGIVADVGIWTLRRACADRRMWAAGDNLNIGVAIDVSVQQLMAPRFVAAIEGVLADTGTDPSLLTLDVTESVFLQDGERALVVLSDLKKAGVNLALDHFGTGIFSLSYLRRGPLDVLKLDHSLISRLTSDWVTLAIVQKVAELGHALGLTIVSEGVESEDVHAKVRDLGSDFYQGSFAAPPMTAGALVSWARPAP